jgi:hypothetical protein
LDQSRRANAAVWLSAKDRNSVTYAANQVDLVLEMFPNSAGDLLFDTVREYTLAPISVEFEVNGADRLVHVISVWDCETGRPPLTGN